MLYRISVHLTSLLGVRRCVRPARPDGYIPLLVEHATKIAGQFAQWPAVRWQVDAEAAAARVCRFAGGWAPTTSTWPSR